MSAESDLYSILSGYAPLTALVGTRIYPDVMPEDVVYPAVVFAINGTTEPITTIDGSTHAEFVPLRIECWAKTRTSAKAVADAVSAALNASKEPPTGRSSGFDPETGLFASLIDLTLLTA